MAAPSLRRVLCLRLLHNSRIVGSNLARDIEYVRGFFLWVCHRMHIVELGWAGAR